MSVPRQAWLTSTDPNKWVAAMMCCRAGDLHCSETGRCLMGDCFSELRQAEKAEAALRETLKQLHEFHRAAAATQPARRRELIAEHQIQIKNLIADLGDLLRQVKPHAEG